MKKDKLLMHKETTVYHIPVLLKESIDALNIKPNGIYVDVTYGGGGHSKEILSRLKNGKLVAFDRDTDAKKNALDDKRLIFVQNNFRFMRNFLHYNNITHVDGILADLGVSSHHFDEGERGFSFRFPEAGLDMRMGKDSDLTAEKVLNSYPLEKLRAIFSEYGEIKQADKVARLIIQAREGGKLQKISDLTDAIIPATPKFDEKQFYAKVFQAIRIEVNKEMLSLKHFLEQTVEVLNAGGRLSVISYHSLEDRLVKNYMKTGNTEGRREKDFYGNDITPFNTITRKTIVPTEEEMKVNPRSRSAKLRVAEKK